ncbi:hypothetical protein [Paenibacillus sp. R14(2021)]|uniref:hypothetical protein n=1 Tax=Paenibacillus sp. R14(2021) TaxID=2859228 RepID=UPI001C614BA1|nr:hypothetical protein [Paenibacillus sp. R14(2021)]
MDKKIKNYYQLKQKQKEIEQELAELREEILSYCSEQGTSAMELGNYRVKIVPQERKEYDETKLFEALPNLELWRLLSRPDSGKIASLIKLNVISEEAIKNAYTVKLVSSLQVERK